MSQKVIIYPGTFDPLTYGHIDIIERGANLGDQLIVAVSLNSGKQPLFTMEERTALVMSEVEQINVKQKTTSPVLVKSFSGLLTDFATEQKATAILRGLRAVADFEYEFQMAGMNSKLAPDVETIFLMASENLQLTSARFVKEIAFHSGKINNFVPDHVIKMFKKKESN